MIEIIYGFYSNTRRFEFISVKLPEEIFRSIGEQYNNSQNTKTHKFISLY